MKRLTTLAAMLLTFAGVSLALGAAGPGKFKSTLTGTGAKTQHGQLDGTWTIDLPNPGAGPVKLSDDGEPRGGGRYVISGSTITLTPKPGGSCATRAKYTLKRSGDKLRFILIKDSCAVRRDILTYGPWTKIG